VLERAVFIWIFLAITVLNMPILRETSIFEKKYPPQYFTLFNRQTLDYQTDNQAFVILCPLSISDRLRAFFDNKMRVFVRKTLQNRLISIF
jgi:hypothetical protein